MSEGRRPPEWMPLAILGGLIVAVDLAIVISELISPTVPSPASSASAAPEHPQTPRGGREQGLGNPSGNAPRASLPRGAHDVREPTGTPRAIATNANLPPPPEPAAAPSAPAVAVPHVGRLMGPAGLGRVVTEAAEAGAADVDHGR